MNRLAKIIGLFLIFFGFVLIISGILSWPPGGLMFALPYFFLIPGIAFAIVGVALLLCCGKRRDSGRTSRDPKNYIGSKALPELSL